MAKSNKNAAKKTYVTKPFLPPFEEYVKLAKGIFERDILTNNGPLVLEFENKIKEYLNVPHFHFTTNGTLALTLALSSLEINEGEIITTPFSYVATVSSILWQRCTPVFVDINSENLTIDPQKIEAAITKQTKAILAVHIYGYACDVEAIQTIATKHNLKVIYDGAHAFGSKYKGESLLNYGDVTTLSFHATKVMHTIEGGGCVFKDASTCSKYNLQQRCGHNGDEHICLGINAKPNEFQAAMGLLNMVYFDEILECRRSISALYDKELKNALQRPKKTELLDYNYAYYPVLFATHEQREKSLSYLEKFDIIPRRYFYPSLNTLPYLKSSQPCPISENISMRIACLPLYYDLSEEKIKQIAHHIHNSL